MSYFPTTLAGVVMDKCAISTLNDAPSVGVDG